ncbi:MAG: hypothetical protein ACOC55_02730 [Candidatus Natronoplasma sp.]
MRPHYRSKLVIILVILLLTPAVIGHPSAPESQNIDPLPSVPKSRSVNRDVGDDPYTYHFKAEKGDDVHIHISSERGTEFQAVLIPVDVLDSYSNYSDVEEERLEEASERQTRSFTAHATIPEKGQYVLVIRSVDGRSTVYNLLIGRGLLSSVIISLGGYFEFVGITAVVIAAPVVAFYLYKNRKEKEGGVAKAEGPQESSYTQNEEDVSEERPPPEEEGSSDEDDKKDEEEEYLGYEN